VEELVGSLVALVSSLIIQTPPMARENSQREYILITEGSTSKEYRRRCLLMKKIYLFCCKMISNAGEISANHLSEVLRQMSDY
jgi:hypothetical protein